MRILKRTMWGTQPVQNCLLLPYIYPEILAVQSVEHSLRRQSCRGVAEVAGEGEEERGGKEKVEEKEEEKEKQ